MYTLMVLLALLSMYFFLRVCQNSSLVLSVGYVLSTTLMLYTHLYGWFALVAQNICVVTRLVLSKDRTFRVRHWVIVQAIVVALFVPWIPFLAGQTSRVLAGQPTAIFIAFRAPPPTADTVIQTFTTYAGTTLLLALFLVLSALSLFTYRKMHGSMNWKAPFKALETYLWDVRIGNIAAVWFLVLWLSIINMIPFVISRFSSQSTTIDTPLRLQCPVPPRCCGNKKHQPQVCKIGSYWCYYRVVSSASTNVFYDCNKAARA